MSKASPRNLPHTQYNFLTDEWRLAKRLQLCDLFKEVAELGEKFRLSQQDST